MRFINNFNKDSEWSNGRVYKGDDWLGKFQGKNLDHRIVNRNNIFLTLNRNVTNLFRRH